MSCCTPTAEPDVIPGPEGVAGKQHFLTADFVTPSFATGGTVAKVSTVNNLGVGDSIFMGGPWGTANFQILEVPDQTSIRVRLLDVAGDVGSGVLIPNGTHFRAGLGNLDIPLAVGNGGTGAKTALGGITNLTSGVMIGQTAITDNGGGAASSTFTPTLGIYVVSFFFDLTQFIPAGSSRFFIFENFIPGYPFQLLATSFTFESPGTSGGTPDGFILWQIDGSALGSAGRLNPQAGHPQGYTEQGVAIPLAVGKGPNPTSTISCLSQGIHTPFTGGAIWIHLTLKNLDEANAFATLAAKCNKIVDALT
jgi:hypothetical protein